MPFLNFLILILALLVFNPSFASPQSLSENIDFSDLETASDEFGSYSIGHNLSTNGRTLKKGQTSIGTLYLAHGFSENLSIGTSIFVFRVFQMANFMARYGFDLNKKQRLSFDTAYFKTFGGKEVRGTVCGSNAPNQPSTCRDQVFGYTGFVMEAVNFKTTFSQQVKDYYRFNTTASYFYYFDDRAPFSFRMDPGNNDDYTVNLTTLHEFRLDERFFINYEIGLWGFNYQYPYIHTGLTVGMQANSWLVGLGMSTTYSPSFPESQLKWFNGGYTSRASYHPEFEIQYFF